MRLLRFMENNQSQKSLNIYLAGPVFTQAERIWNRRLAEGLRAKGYQVILPQDEAARFITPQGVDAKAIAELCYKQALDSDVMVAVLDGADSDSGASMELGFKIHDKRINGTGKIIGVRTDFRAAEDGQLNLMFRLLDEVIYLPSFNEDMNLLVLKIDETIRKS